MDQEKKHNVNRIIALLIIITNFICKNNEYVLLSSTLIVTVIVIIAVLDRNYKQNYNRYIPKWVLCITLAFGFYFVISHYVELFFIKSEMTKSILFFIGNAVVAIFLFFILRGFIIKWPSKRKILLPVLGIIYVALLGILIWICLGC